MLPHPAILTASIDAPHPASSSLSGRKKIAGDPDRVDDIEDDYVPITDAAVKSVFDGKGKRLGGHLIEQRSVGFTPNIESGSSRLAGP